MCVVKLEACPMRAVIAAIVASRVATWQCERIIKIYSVLIFPLVALLHRLTHRSLCERTFIYFNDSFTLHAQRQILLFPLIALTHRVIERSV